MSESVTRLAIRATCWFLAFTGQKITDTITVTLPKIRVAFPKIEFTLPRVRVALPSIRAPFLESYLDASVAFSTLNKIIEYREDRTGDQKNRKTRRTAYNRRQQEDEIARIVRLMNTRSSQPCAPFGPVEYIYIYLYIYIYIYTCIHIY